MTDEQIEAVAQELWEQRVPACPVRLPWSMVSGRRRSNMLAMARWHIQQVEAAVRKEREACAKIADGYERRAAGVAVSTEYDDGVESAAEFIAEDIRQRGGEGA